MISLEQNGKHPPLITLEGGEGVGKSTQQKMLARRVRAMGFQVALTREPGGTNLGRHLRGFLEGGLKDRLSDKAELMLFLADRAQHVEEVIAPALARGEVVVCDRFTDSSEVYQGRCRGLGLQQVRRFNRLVCGDIWPELTIVLDLDPKAGLARVLDRQKSLGLGLDRMESEDRSFHQKVREGFLKQAEGEPERVKVVDAAAPAEEVAAEIWLFAEPVLRKWKSLAS